ncbi:hypothetical protein STIUS_v1c01310 [Spiroplasma sp. TIUS-1]|uniref:hypothetical protein n=1 Tax=Spiroplasma sp. TIUS-1 TaxID=216963 RepID=UPI001397CE1B|nr:hypothetical protein [Spiroplasma sp. TIUS-1]QHX35686.1 hypothetical protein STIUS_v1c01310 [Spiroplasma sp. TIUS-1]
MKTSRNLDFTIKVIILNILVAFLIFDFCSQIWLPKYNLGGIPTIERINIYYAFWTTQSNYIVVFYLIFTISLQKIYGTQRLLGLEIAVTTYITVTFIVFWFGLLASPDEIGAYRPINWVSTIVLHLAIPMFMVFNFATSTGNVYMSIEEFNKVGILLVCAYPFLYLIFVMVRGELRFIQYSEAFFEHIYSYNDNNTFPGWESLFGPDGVVIGIIDREARFGSQFYYPYWFLDIHKYRLTYNLNSDGTQIVSFAHDNPQWTYIVMFVGSCFGIAGVFIGVTLGFLSLNNSKYYRWHTLNDVVLSKEEHDYRMAQRKANRYAAKQERRKVRIHDKVEWLNFKRKLRLIPKEYHEREIEEFKREKNQIWAEQQWGIEEYIIAKRQYKKVFDDMIAGLSKKDSDIVLRNIKEAKRFQKLVKKGVTISKVRFE